MSHLKGLRLNPQYRPATGEYCEVSGPNCDDDNGYTWSITQLLWSNEEFVLYGVRGCWPVLHKREHVLFRELTLTLEERFVLRAIMKGEQFADNCSAEGVAGLKKRGLVTVIDGLISYTLDGVRVAQTILYEGRHAGN